MEEVRFDRNFTGKPFQDGCIAFIKASFESPQYVRLVGSARNGTIAIADFGPSKLLSKDQFATERARDPLLESYGVQKRIRELRDYYSWEYYLNHYYHSALTFHLRFDGTDKLIKPASFDQKQVYFVWLKGYEGPTEKKFDKAEPNKQPDIPAKDKLGGEVKIGDLIATTKSNTLYVGTVDRVTPSGKSVYLTSIGGKSSFMVEAGSNIIIIDDMTKKRAMLKKLAMPQ